MFPTLIINAICKVSPILGTALGGPVGSIVGSLISSVLGGVDMQDSGQVVKVLNDPDSIKKLKELELQFSDLQNARLEAAKETGYLRFVRPLLAIFSMFAICGDIIAIEYTTNEMLSQILVIMLVILVWDVRQIYRFYFGSGDDLPNFPFLHNKKK